MKCFVSKAFWFALVLAVCSLPALGQISTVGSITGTVMDPQGATVPNASVTVKNNATGDERTVTTSENGIFSVPQLPSGVYTITIEAGSGFKKAQLTAVKVDVGAPTAVKAELELGNPQETVTIVGGGEVLQTQTANVGNVIVGRQITELPFTSRDALDLVLALPGTQTPARPRSSTINGLPRGSLTITMDGLPDQAEDSKSGDGFFTFVRPRIDAIEEVSLSSAVPGAESSGDGAVQIKFNTRGGTSEFHGSGYWYHRNTALNSNYYFNNLAGTPRQAMILNQPGVRVGGPILIPGILKSRDRAFFFVNYEEFRIPGSTARSRNVLNTDAQAGIFRYGSTTRNLFTIAGNTDCDTTTAGVQPCTNTIDPVIGATLANIRATLTGGALSALGDNQQRFNFNSPASQVRKFTTVRFDFNLTSKHHLENIWNYNVFDSYPDQLNSRDNVFPGLGIGLGGQYSLRFSDSIALRSTLRSNLTNELRAGLGAGGTVLFFPETSPAPFAQLGGFNPSFTVFAPGNNSTSSPAAGSSSSRNHAPARVIVDNLAWVKGNHSTNFGFEFAQYNSFAFSISRVVPAITFGLDTNDPANAMFTTGTTGNFPGAASADITNAKNLYALLTGRVTTITASAFRNEDTGNYSYLGPFVNRARQRTLGFYGQDSWRVRENVTINAGLRYELQLPFVALNKNYTQVVNGYDGVWGVSGTNNLFKPGTLSGSVTAFEQFPQNTHAYDVDWNNFGPSIGVAWSPSPKSGFIRTLLGGAGQSVLRGGYSIAFVREGSDVFNSVTGGNPGGTLTATRSIALNTVTPGTLFRNPAALAPPTIPAVPVFPMTPTSAVPYSASDAANGYIPNLKVGMAHSWSIGYQRELNKDTVIEARYVGTRGTDLWRQLNLNETNITENGFINEYRLALLNLQANVAANGGAGRCQSGVTSAGCQNNFAYFGPGTGTFPLPITLGYFSGATNPNSASSYSSANFRSTTFTNSMSPANASARAFAISLNSDLGRRNNAAAAYRCFLTPTASGCNSTNGLNLPPNFFVLNPDTFGGAFIVDNGAKTRYDSFQIELRRRLSKGLLVQGSYVFSKSLSNMYSTSGVVNYQPSTLRHEELDKLTSPFDLTHAFKANWIWELPFGRGQSFLSNANGLVDRLAGGWAIHGQARIQSGSTFSLGNVQLVGMTREEFQKAIKIRPDSTGQVAVFFLPNDIIENTRRAFNTCIPSAPTVVNPACNAQGYGTATLTNSAGALFAGGTPTGRYIAPANSNGCIQEYVGQCGFSNLIVYGPGLTRFDISIVKKTKITETANIELRAEFLNAFNNINFKIGSQTAADTSVTNFTSSGFGTTAAAYQDLSTTNDVGGRMIQLVLRINF